MSSEDFTWIKDKEKFHYIKQYPNLCVPCSIENILKYYDCNSFDQFSLAFILVRLNKNFGFVGFKDILSHLLKDSFNFILKTNEDVDHDSPEKVFNFIKQIIKDEGIPVAVSFKSLDATGTPVESSAHIRIAIAYNDDEILFFEQEPNLPDDKTFNLEQFKKHLKNDHHTLIIRKI